MTTDPSATARSGLFRRLRLGPQGAVIGGIVMLGLTLVAGAILLAGVNSARSIDAQAASLAMRERTHAVYRAFVNARNLEQQFNLFRKPELAESFQAQAQGLIADVQDLRQGSSGADLQLRMAGLERLLAIYRDQVGEAQRLWRQVGLSENDGLQNTTRTTRLDLEKLLRLSPDAEIGILRVGKHEKEFMARLSPERNGMTHSAVRETRAAITKTIRNPRDRDRYLALITTYEAAFTAMADARVAIAAAEQEAATAFAASQPMLRDLVERAQGDLEASAARQKELTEATMRLVSLGSVGVCVLTLAVVMAAGGWRLESAAAMGLQASEKWKAKSTSAPDSERAAKQRRADQIDELIQSFDNVVSMAAAASEDGRGDARAAAPALDLAGEIDPQVLDIVKALVARPEPLAGAADALSKDIQAAA